MASDQSLVAAALPLYEVEGELGRGAWGMVLAGEHRQLGRHVAIKMLPHAFGADPAVRARFFAEGRLLASLEHPHIVPIYDFVEHDGLCVLVMERLTGGTVWSRCQTGGVTPQVACALVLAACAALDYAHRHGVLHRDIKPENMMFSSTGVLKVTDFGIAKVVGGAATVATRAGEVLGTPAYMAPEQAQGGELTPATDIYAVGTVLYQLLSNELPFPADTNPIAMLYRHVHEAPKPLEELAPHVPRALAEVTARTLEKDPARRYATAEQLAVAVAEAAAASWGPGWLASTKTTVTASGPVLSAALGQRADVPAETIAPGALTALTTAPPVPTETPPADLVPVTALEPPAPRHEPPPAPPPGATVDFGAAAAPPPLPAAPAPRKRRRGLIVALVAIVAVIAAIVVASSGGGDGAKKVASTAGQILLPAADWKPIPDAPTARQQLSVASTDRALWVLGGLTEQQSTTKVERYEPSTDKWRSGPALPLALHHEMAATYRGDLVVLGGWVPVGDNLNATTSDRVFTLKGGKWKELPKLRHPRAAGVAAVAGDKLVVFGGQASGKLVPQTEWFDGTRWFDGPDIPTPRDHLGGASDGTFVYALGGRDLSSDKNFDAFERYDPAANKWEPLPPMPAPRGGLGATFIGGRIVAVGGETATASQGTVETFDLAARAWAPGPGLVTPRHGAGVAALGAYVYAIDGALQPGHSTSAATAERLNFTAKPAAAAEWQPLRDAPTPRLAAAATSASGTIWVAGGLVDGAPTAKVEGYDPTIDSWKAGPDLPVALHSATAATYHGEVVVIGGYVRTGTRGNREAASARVFALRQGGWAELPPLREGRAAAAAAAVGERLIVAGGEGDDGLLATTEVLEGNRWGLGADIPTPRADLAAASDGHYVFVVGGRADTPLGNVDRYDPDAHQWVPLAGLPTHRYELGAGIVKGRLVAVGGQTSDAALPVVETFDLRGTTWVAAAPLKVPRHGAAVVAYRNAIYALGGGLQPGRDTPSPASEVLRF